jgi:hypothetical protein
MRYGLFILVLLFGVLSYSKNRIIFTLANADPKKLPDLYVLTDYKKGVNSKRFIESEVLNYASTDEYIVYQTKDGKLYIIKDFDSYYKTPIADVTSYRIYKNSLYYETVLNNIKTLFVINDFKSLRPNEIMQNYRSYDLDQ